ncbi:hypothetical protein ADL26_16915 [Thermoactinomyces vulgaris]|nr:hypothetical protein ADL26_16915 [Thermoactinomyces vulgaris]
MAEELAIAADGTRFAVGHRRSQDARLRDLQARRDVRRYLRTVVAPAGPGGRTRERVIPERMRCGRLSDMH